MNDVLDDVVISTAKVDPEKPKRFHVEVWSNELVCGGKLSAVIVEVFDVPVSVAVTLARAARKERKVTVALGMTREMAEEKSEAASAMMYEMMGKCSCGSKSTFVPVPAAQ